VLSFVKDRREQALKEKQAKEAKAAGSGSSSSGSWTSE